MDDLAGSGDLVMKSFGAQKVFCVPQNPPGAGDGGILELKGKLDKLNLNLNFIKNRFNEKFAKLSQIEAFKQKEENISKLKKTHTKLENELQTRMEVNPVTRGAGDAIDDLEARVNVLGEEERVRMRIFREILNFISDNLNLSQSEIFDDFGLDKIPNRFHGA